MTSGNKQTPKVDMLDCPTPIKLKAEGSKGIEIHIFDCGSHTCPACRHNKPLLTKKDYTPININGTIRMLRLTDRLRVEASPEAMKQIDAALGFVPFQSEG